MTRLHGTWLPPSAFDTQRPLPSPLAPQPLLQDKLARSRIHHFVSIIFSRPPTRDKSLFERIVLGVMWPAAFLLLGIAVFEAYRHLSSSSNPNSMLPRAEESSVLRGVEDVLVAGKRKGWGLPPMVLEIMAVGFIALGWKLWPTDTLEEEVEIHEE